MEKNTLNHLEQLESESIYIIREVFSNFERPGIMFSGGKDSILLTYLVQKSFAPAKIPFPLIHIDTGHNFPETIQYRDELVARLGVDLVVGSVQELIDLGQIKEEQGIHANRNLAQIPALLHIIEKNQYDALLGGARRDEEKARAKERIFSHRDEFGGWNPKNQRPELWNLYNGKKNIGEHFRVFPISNWTELDVWMYLAQEKIPLPDLYFAKPRRVFERNGMLISENPYSQIKSDEVIEEQMVRFRTMGDITITGAYPSEALTIEEIIQEISISRTTERGSRADDKRSETSMEDRKKEGYF
ncbi:MAG: sulfate adenylyltransferase subunit 2 [Chitinophagales bacterium]|jgi:sulfate adenylyltransferase subunit 2|nr:sulfate adenylyltransferase subunit 2 [Chitinophagales bacterium]